MRVLSDENKVFNKFQHRCTGFGNSTSSCGSLLEVDERDLFKNISWDCTYWYKKGTYHQSIKPVVNIAFECVKCGKRTDVNTKNLKISKHVENSMITKQKAYHYLVNMIPMV